MRDKIHHFMYCWFLGTLAAAIAETFCTGFVALWTVSCAPFMVIGVGKEFIDKYDKDPNTCPEILDLVADMLGGLGGVCLILVVGNGR